MPGLGGDCHVYHSISEAIRNSKVNRFHLTIMAICMTIVAVEGYDLVIYGSIKHQLIDEWGMTTVQAGMVGSVALIGMMVGSLSLGILADLLGRKPVLIFCFILFCVTTGLIGFTHEPISFSVGRFFAGVGIGGAMPNAIGLLSDYIPEKHKSTMIATTMSGMQVGGILAPLIAIAFGYGGWRHCFWIAFVPLVLLPVMIKLLPNSIDFSIKRGKTAELLRAVEKAAPGFTLPEVAQDTGTESVSQKEKEKFPVRELFEEGRARNTFLFWIAFFMGLLMIYGLNTWLPELMQSAGYEVGSSLTFLLALNLAALFGSFFMGRIADRVNTKYVLVTLYIIGATCMVLLSIKSNIVVAYILISICGICAFCPQNVGTAFVASNYPSRVRSTGLGVCNTVGRLGGIMGPTLGGILMAAALPMFLNCVAFAVPGLIAATAYGLCVQLRSAGKPTAAELTHH